MSLHKLNVQNLITTLSDIRYTKLTPARSELKNLNYGSCDNFLRQTDYDLSLVISSLQVFLEENKK